MPQKFSQRKGYIPVNQIIQTQGMNDALRNGLWSALYLAKWPNDRARDYDARVSLLIMRGFGQALWVNYFKVPVDELPRDFNEMLDRIRRYFFACDWFEVYDFLEFSLAFFRDDQLNQRINEVLESDLSGYRIVAGVVTDITSEQEVLAIETALADADFPAVNAHLKRALELLADKKQPDYRNSIKESISAVESLSRHISGNAKATLGDALKIIEKSGRLHPALRDALLKLYGYTSDESGIRHSMLDLPDIGVSEARFFLVSCTCFVNYLKARL